MIKAVIFDLDGTLINSIFDLADSTNHALKKFGFPTHDIEAYKIFVGDGMPKLIERALPKFKRDNETIATVLEEFLAYYRKHYLDKTVLYDGIFELLKDLQKSGYKLCVVSNKSNEMTTEILNNLFEIKFNAFSGKKDGYKAKPDPKLTLEIINSIGVNPNECAFIGDSGMDMQTAVNANCLPIGVLWGFRGKEELLQNGAEYLVNKPNEILEILKKVWKVD